MIEQPDARPGTPGPPTDVVALPAHSTIRKVVVPSAGDLDQRVIRVGADLAHRLDAELEVVSVVSPGLQQIDATETLAQAREAEVPLDVRMIADHGDVVGDLLRAGGDDVLLCLGTRGAGPLSEAVFGSIAAELVRRTDRPVLVVGPRCPPGLGAGALAVAVDGSPDSELVVSEAVEFAPALGMPVQLVEVLTTAHVDDGARLAALGRLRDLAAHQRREVPWRDPLVLAGTRVDEALVELTRRPDIALLAMSTHGAGRLERLFAGSVTLDVIGRAEVPVLVCARRGRR